jgi:hypothetical protein
MSPLVLDFIKSAFLPAVGVAVLFLLTGWLRDPMRARIQSLVFALGFAAGAAVLIGWPNLPPSDVNQAFTWSALALVLFVLVSPRPVGSRYALRAFFVVALGLLTLWPIRESLHGHVHLRNLLAFFFLGLGTWSIVERSAQKVQPLTLYVLPLISGTGLSLLLVVKGSISMSNFVSILCALIGGIATLSLIFPKKVSAAAMMPFISVFMILFMVCGHFYLDINPWFMIYLCAPFLVLWIRNWLPYVPRQPLAEAAVLGVISAAPVAYFIYTVFKSSGPLY